MAPDERGGAAVVAFVGAVRAAGVDVPVGSTVLFARALGTGVGPYWAGRATLVRRPEDIDAYDRAFAGLAAPVPPPAAVVEVAADADDDDATDDELGADDAGNRPTPAPNSEVERRVLRWSATEVLRAKDLAACSADELAEAQRLVADLRLRAALRPSRRRRADRRPRAGARIDLRRTVRAAVRHGGEVGRPATTSPGERPRRVVLLLDVSGSMAPYARALARFAHAAVRARRRGHVEVFALGTRLTRITRELATNDPDEALRRAAAAVTDWDGGTRLGEGLRRFNDDWGVRGVARGATVVVLSDGWDRGDPDALGAEVARLGRVAHRVVWVNPLKASPGYAPLARGMAAALPHVDEFVEGHSVDALEDLAVLLGER